MHCRWCTERPGAPRKMPIGIGDAIPASVCVRAHTIPLHRPQQSHQRSEPCWRWLEPPLLLCELLPAVPAQPPENATNAPPPPGVNLRHHRSILCEQVIQAGTTEEGLGVYARTINEHYASCPDRRSVWTGRRPNHWSRTGCAGKHALASFFILNQHYVTTAHAGLVSLPGIETTTAR